MPQPDPDGVYLVEHGDGRTTLGCDVWAEGNRRHRIARMMALAHRLRRGGWRCWRCGDELPLFKRADARFCSETCKRARARARRFRAS